MRLQMRAPLIAVSGWLILVLASHESLACSVCLAGDPSFSSSGASAQEAGDFSMYLEVRGWQKQSGLLPHDEEAAPSGHEPEDAEAEEGDGAEAEHEHEDADEHEGSEQSSSQRLDLYLGWTPIDRLTATLLLPWRFNEITEYHEGEQSETSRLNGFGDLSLHLGYVLWRDRDVLPATWVEARGFFKAPSGKSSQTVDGEQDPHLQVGTGSWDFGFGLAAAHRLAWASLYASAFYRENLEGSLEYRYGDVVLTNVAGEVPLSHFCENPVVRALTPGIELNFRYAEQDRSHGEHYHDSGGSVLYSTPHAADPVPGSGAAPPWCGSPCSSRHRPLAARTSRTKVRSGRRASAWRIEVGRRTRARLLVALLARRGADRRRSSCEASTVRRWSAAADATPTGFVVHFWASWCPSCLAELAALDEAALRVPGRQYA